MRPFHNKPVRRDRIHYFKLLKGALGMLRNPEGTDSVFDIEDGLRDGGAYRVALARLRGIPAVRRMIEQRYLAPTPDLEQLLRCPDGSLGSVFAHHIVDHGFDADYFRKIAVVDDMDYVLMRMRQTHDLWHVITGFDTSRIGEIALKAFELAQVRRPMSAVIVAGGVLRFLAKDPDQVGDLLRAISTGYRLGLAAQPFLGQKWELGWDRPVAAWRAELGVDLAAADPDQLAMASASA